MQANHEQSASGTTEEQERVSLVAELRSKLIKLSELIDSAETTETQLLLVPEVLSREPGDGTSWEPLRSRLLVLLADWDNRVSQPLFDFFSTDPVGTGLVAVAGAVAPNTLIAGGGWTALANFAKDRSLEGKRPESIEAIRDRMKKTEESVGTETTQLRDLRNEALRFTRALEILNAATTAGNEGACASTDAPSSALGETSS